MQNSCIVVPITLNMILEKTVQDERSHDSIFTDYTMTPQTMQYVSEQTQAKSLQKVLIVDDEPDINMIAKISLESFGKYDVETCSSGVDALEVLTWFKPDMILLDVMMPYMDGEETIRRIKQNPKTAYIPVVFVTAKIFKNDMTRYKDLGALDVIPKPFDPIALPKQIRQIWDGLNTKIEVEREIEEKLREMQTSFMEGMSARLILLRTQWSEFKSTNLPGTLMDVYNTIHKITGVSGTLNLNDLYKRALKIERKMLNAIEEDDSQLSTFDKQQIEGLITVLGESPYR
jgi:two-component system, OmpR family, response regulator